MEIHVGTLKSKIITDNPKLLEAFYELYGFDVPGKHYVTAYKKRQWDGKKRYFKRNGEFRTGLLPRILNDLKKIDAKPTIKSDRNSEQLELKTVKKFKYFDYQEEAINYILQNKRGIIESPVGSGKTLIMAGLIQSLAPRKIVVMFREKGILRQTYEFFKSCGIKSLGINFGEGYIYGDVMLTTVQSIEKILDTHLEEAGALIIDEAHQFCKGETTVAAIEAFPNAVYRAAFTATVPSEKGDIHGRLTLEGAFGEVFSTKTTDDLVKDGKLAKPIIQIIQYAPSGDFEGKTYHELYESHIVDSVERNAKIKIVIDNIIESNPKAKILILVKNLRHLQTLAGMVDNVYVVQGDDDISDRYDKIERFIADQKAAIIIGTNVMQTGININEITHMINARGLEGEIPTIQGLGRGLRVTKDKTTLYFYDFYDKVPYLEKHSKSRINHYEKLKFEINYVRLDP